MEMRNLIDKILFNINSFTQIHSFIDCGLKVFFVHSKNYQTFLSIMEVMEEGNLMDRIPILLQRDMEYYEVNNGIT